MDSTTLPIITTERLVLRWISEDDVESLYEIFSDPQVMRYWSTVPLKNRDAAAELQREIAESNESEKMIKWGLALRDSNTVIGSRLRFHRYQKPGYGEKESQTEKSPAVERP